MSVCVPVWAAVGLVVSGLGSVVVNVVLVRGLRRERGLRRRHRCPVVAPSVRYVDVQVLRPVFRTLVGPGVLRRSFPAPPSARVPVYGSDEPVPETVGAYLRQSREDPGGLCAVGFLLVPAPSTPTGVVRGWFLLGLGRLLSRLWMEERGRW